MVEASNPVSAVTSPPSGRPRFAVGIVAFALGVGGTLLYVNHSRQLAAPPSTAAPSKAVAGKTAPSKTVAGKTVPRKAAIAVGANKSASANSGDANSDGAAATAAAPAASSQTAGKTSTEPSASAAASEATWQIVANEPVVRVLLDGRPIPVANAARRIEVPITQPPAKRLTAFTRDGRTLRVNLQPSVREVRLDFASKKAMPPKHRKRWRRKSAKPQSDDGLAPSPYGAK